MSRALFARTFCCALFCLATLLVGGVACGAGAGEGGGDHNLPSRLAGPYGKLSPDPDTEIHEPIVLEDPQGELAYYGPSALFNADGSYTVYFTAEGELEGAHIRRAEGVDLAHDPSDVAVVLEAEETWEATRVAQPSVITPGILGAPLGLFFEAGDGNIGYVESADGLVFSRIGEGPLLEPEPDPSGPEGGAGLREPSAVWSGHRVLLYYSAGSPRSIFVASVTPVGDDSVAVSRLDADEVSPGRDPVLSPSGVVDSFDEVGLGAPFVSISNEVGREVFDLWYVGLDAGGDRTVGFAGSHDGLGFGRLDQNPVLPRGSPPEGDPCVVGHSTTAVMFYTQGAGDARSIGAARYP